MTVYTPIGGGGGGGLTPPVVITGTAPAMIPLTVNGVGAGQTADILDINTVSGLNNFKFRADGSLAFGTGGFYNRIGSGGGGGGNFFVESALAMNFIVEARGGIWAGSSTPGVGGAAGPYLWVGTVTTAPSSGTSGGGMLYVAAGGSLHYRGPTTDTQVAPA